MTTLTEIGTWLDETLPSLIEKGGVPAASVAVLAHGDVVSSAAGILNNSTGVEADTASLFQIGSITKVWTATLIMQLVDEELLDLDTAVKSLLPDFSLGDESAAATITVRQLLSHVSGFEGDFFTDTGTGDDCVEKYIGTLSDAPQLFTPGERFSYNNAAFVVLGRIIEVLRDAPFDRVLRAHLIDPLGLSHVATDATQAIMFRAAVGHVAGGGEDPVPAPVWSLVRSNAPAGAMLSMTAEDLVAFARLHIDKGLSADGSRLLSASCVEQMQHKHVDVPELGLMGSGWGLGWSLYDWEGGPVIGHDGGTIGQAAFLRVVPEKGVAVAILTNGGMPFDIYRTVMTHVLSELADVAVPPLPMPADPLPHLQDVSRFLGVYSSAITDSTVRQDDDGRIWLEQSMKGIFADLGPDPAPVELVAWRKDALITRTADKGVHLPHAFVGDDGNGKAQYLHTGRADRRIPSR